MKLKTSMLSLLTQSSKKYPNSRPLLARRGIILLTAFLFLPAAGAQQPVSQQQPFTIKVATQLVLETVVVKDKDKDDKDIEVELPIRGLPVIGTFMGAPDEPLLNDELRNSDKKYELGWMYTVIAGVLNILVIYDAFAGAAFGAVTAKAQGPPAPQTEAKKEEAAVA